MPAPHLVPINHVLAGTKGDFYANYEALSGEVSVSISWFKFALWDWPPRLNQPIILLPKMSVVSYLSWTKQLYHRTISECVFYLVLRRLLTHENLCSILSGCTRLHHFTRVNSRFPDPSETPKNSVCIHWERLRISAPCSRARTCNKLITRLNK